MLRYTYIACLAFVVPAAQLIKDAASFEGRSNCLKWLVSSEPTRTSLGGNSGPPLRLWSHFPATLCMCGCTLERMGTVRKAAHVRPAVPMAPGLCAPVYATLPCPQFLMTNREPSDLIRLIGNSSISVGKPPNGETYMTGVVCSVQYALPSVLTNVLRATVFLITCCTSHQT